jgi:hypothetical protein
VGERYAIHIENKPDHRKWEVDQALNYRLRAADRMAKWRYVDFVLVLLAPKSFVERWPEEANGFDRKVLYEDVCRFIPEFTPTSA